MTQGPADIPDTAASAFRPPDPLAPVFTANAAFVRWGETGFIVEFGDNFDGIGIDRARIIGQFSPSAMKAIAGLLADHVGQYEARFGPIAP